MTIDFRTVPRVVGPRLREALSDSPAVLIHGPRQSGKTTLARTTCEPRGYWYVTLDDDAQLAAVRADPAGFIQSLPPKTILDEVQRAPEIFTSLKAEIDRDRRPGRFVLTGSANVFFVPALADSLAGRMAMLRLHPLAQSEIAGHRARFIDTLFGGGPRTGIHARLGRELATRIVTGGYPAALARRTPARQRAWYRDYVNFQIERDVRDLSRLRSFDALPKLMALVASHTASLVNVAELASPFELTRQTIHEYLALLEHVFLIDRLPPWHSGRLRRLVKRPKLHIGDTGVACALLRLDADALEADRRTYGALLESFVFQELRRQASGRPDPVDFFHYRDRDDFEVDIVLEQGSAVVGIEVKAAASVSERDLRGLRKLKQSAGRHFISGVVLYDGTATIRFEDNLFAVPIGLLWNS